ncbi:hypothetical protein SAMN04487911_10535 [Arenibacter nanhaiticus]|uniref:Uncharacterized protein n=1 Tax=Arenibacter nanhaiticus TaxID=558155 RepID=A0A1M6DJL5_9FLAO|nr:hypothetical protein [Arenibacter nanhaiticus]SHI73331.1 hypothetical protein SAMN04487911_10535 [Arenibacter nanhaiticus]
MNSDTHKPQTPKSFMRTMTVLHAVLTTGVFIILVAVYYSSDALIFGFQDTEDIYRIIIPLVAMIGYFGGNLIFKKQLDAIDPKASLKSILSRYSSASIIKYAFIEGAAIFSLIAFSRIHNVFYLVISVLLLLYLWSQRPTKLKVMSDLKLKKDHEELFMKNEETLP